MTQVMNPEEYVRAMLRAIGEDPDREGLRDTPKRVLKALQEMTAGNALDPADVLGVTFDGDGYDQIVSLGGIPFTSMCEHHLLPFSGKAAIAYLPSLVDGKTRVVGLSKMARVVDIFARRLQLQERLTAQIANAIESHLQPRGVAVIVEAEHACMVCRGVRKPGARMGTSEMRGAFRDSPSARAEVLQLLGRCS